MNIIPTGVLYNLATLFLLLLTLMTSYIDAQVLAAPYFGVVALGIFTVLIYNTDKHTKRFTTETDFNLLSRFETLMDDKQFQHALDISEDGLWEYNFEEDTMQISRPLKEWLGVEESIIEHAADFWINKVHPRDWNKLPESWIPEDFAKLRKKIRSMSGSNISFEIRLSDSRGTYKWVRVRLKVSNHGIKTTLSGSFKDIDSEKHAKAQISQLSYYDTTTRLPNISSMILHINEALKDNTPHGILSINIDNFKMVNDLMGFFTGDELLGKISRGLAGRLPDYAHLYRFGGDEFVIINDKPETSVEVAKIVQRCFDDILGFNNTYMRITCSIGISVFPTKHAYDTESILKCTDIALEQAKKNGKNRYALFEDTMIEELNQRRDLINALESSHMRDNFEIHYQKFHHEGGYRLNLC
jgi:diguanylate cyclase (GGDEF)-like protein